MNTIDEKKMIKESILEKSQLKQINFSRSYSLNDNTFQVDENVYNDIDCNK